ncbi:MAG: MBL fold metallo-hydrolase [Desulfobacteraceae bacterium]|nr:MBL fold metallo-hydrolase [Desulfobacteraceae bacterium]
MSEYIFSSLKGNSMKLDGGAMFGNAPKALWQRWIMADDKNMIDIGSRSMLIQTPRYKILFETGAGAYLSPPMKKRFQVVENNHVLLDSLLNQGLTHADITHVILSHLHFDHAGGLLKEFYDGCHSIELLFPNARFITGKTQYERSASPHIRDRASFIPQLDQLLEKSGRLELKFDQDVMDLDGLEIMFLESHGHTPGMLLSQIRAKDVNVLFLGDAAPGHHWINLPITMGYDRNPELLIDEKQIFLEKAYNENSWVFYTHDYDYAASKLAYDEKKKRYVPIELVDDFNLFVV